MGAGGRPRKEIDWSIFENLCKIQCTQESICAFFEVDSSTLNRHVKEQYGESFAEVFAKKRTLGHNSLRQKQFEVALKGNPTMLIFLGKNYLKQSDKQEIDLKSTDGTMSPKQGLAAIDINSEIFQDLLRLDDKLSKAGSSSPES